MTTDELEKGGGSMDLAVHVNQDYCISAGKCVADEPTVFQFDDDEVAEPTGATDGVDRARLLDTVRNCPSGAITLVDAAGLTVES